jgi:hypothetical protein
MDEARKGPGSQGQPKSQTCKVLSRVTSRPPGRKRREVQSEGD